MLAARSESVIERELRFTSDDVQLFAAASGDCNPLHLDAEFCRQTSFGVRIVHGALVAIGLLGLVPADELARQCHQPDTGRFRTGFGLGLRRARFA